LLKVENFQLQIFFPDGKFMSANHILQIFLSAENFPEWKWEHRGKTSAHAPNYENMAGNLNINF
jgi:hypothetical protein